MCKILGVSKSGYYHWLKLGPSRLWLENQKLSSLIQDIFKDSFSSYGSPSIQSELVARLMKAIN